MLDTFIQPALGGCFELKLTVYAYAEDLFDAAERQRFQLFIVFINPHIACSPHGQYGPRPDAPAILRQLKHGYGTPLVVVHNGHSGFPEEDFRSAGADAVLGMPFSFQEFSVALRRLLNIPGMP